MSPPAVQVFPVVELAIGLSVASGRPDPVGAHAITTSDCTFKFDDLANQRAVEFLGDYDPRFAFRSCQDQAACTLR
jgi:hypothetical protein